MYSQSWNDRSYGIFLFCYCWFIPLLIIFFSYMGIIYHTRSSRKRLLTQKNIELPKDAEDGKNKNKEKLKRTDTADSSHSPRRVSSKLIYRKITICYYWLWDEFDCIRIISYINICFITKMHFVHWWDCIILLSLNQMMLSFPREMQNLLHIHSLPLLTCVNNLLTSE